MSRHIVREALDVYALREAVGKLAAELGFQRRECAELLIVVSELCTNIVKYGVRGSLEVERHIDAVQGWVSQSSHTISGQRFTISRWPCRTAVTIGAQSIPGVC